MFKKISLLLALLPLMTFTNPKIAKSSPSVVYSCIQRNGNPTTVAYTSEGTIELIVWKRETFSGSGWTPLRRCEEVSARYQKYYDQKILRYIGTGRKNGYNIICVLEQVRKGWQCRSNGILITLEEEDDPDQVMKELFNTDKLKSTGPIVRGGNTTGTIIDWEEYMENAPIIEPRASVNPPQPIPQPVIKDDNNVIECQPPLCN